MTRYVALLRGVNVGGKRKLAMSDLRELLTGLGYEGVRTHLQSGNAVLTSPDDASPERVGQEIEAAIVARLGMDTKVLVRTRQELQLVIAENPLSAIADNPSRLLVAFLSHEPDRALVDALAPADFEPDVFAFGEREIYAWYPEGVHKTKLSNAFWEKRFGVVATGRNWNTVTKLLELLDES